MRKCKHCQSEIDPKATKCPKCQSDLRSWFRRHPIMTALLVLFGIGIIGSATSPKKTATTKTEVVNTTTEQPATKAPEKVVVTPLDVDTLSMIKEFDGNQLASEEKYKDKFVKLGAYIKNISEDIVGTPFLSLQPTAEQYYFGTSIQCYFKSKSDLLKVKNGEYVTVTGNVSTQSLGIISVKDCVIVE